MAKLNLNNAARRKEISQNDASQGTEDRILSLIHSGMQDVDALASAFATVNSALGSRKTTDTDNTVKLRKVEIDAKKEDNRHIEEMAKIEREWKKISDEVADRESMRSFIQGQIQRFQDHYDKIMSMETEDYLRETARLEDLHKIIVELTKELRM